MSLQWRSGLMTSVDLAALPEYAMGTPCAVPEVFQRRLPYPYRGMLAICSDLDETPDIDCYLASLRFLNTTESTAIGTGVGLETGNSMYFDMAPGQVSYWNASERARAKLRTLMRSGHIDCLHSFGDLASSREHAHRALDELDRHDCRLEVWVDHAVAPTNFGADIMRGTGDVPASPAYHADLTFGYGIRYVWRGRVTSVTGQEVKPTVLPIFTRHHPAASARTLAKEATKALLGRAWNDSRYGMHAPNELLRPVRLRSGHVALEFIRSNPHWAGVSRGDTADGLAEVLTPRTLDDLVQREAFCVLYTHLGKVHSRARPFGAATSEALRLLAQYASEKKLLVTTTRRLLGYCAVTRDLEFTTTMVDDTLLVGMRTAREVTPLDLQGLSFYVSEAVSDARLSVNGGQPIPLDVNGPDHTGRRTISVRWSRLEYPRL
jgi:hypothetical protein